MRRTLALLLLVTAVATPAHADPPENDDPANAIPVEAFPATLEVDTSEATTGPFEEECYSSLFYVPPSPARAVWYRVTIPEDAYYLKVSNTGAASVVLWDRIRTLPTGDLLLDRRSCAYEDEYMYVGPGEVYMSVSSSLLDGGGTFTIELDAVDDFEPPPVPNDEPYRATRIPSLPYEVEQDTSGADYEYDAQGCSDGSFVWYTYTPSSAETIQVTVTHLDQNYANVAVYSLGDQVETLGCDGDNEVASVATDVEPNVPILIGIGDYGELRLRVNAVEANEPDVRADALALGLGARVPFDTTGATLEPGEPDSCGTGGSLWYALPSFRRDAVLSVTGGASAALVAGDAIQACSTSGSLSVPASSTATHVQVRGETAQGVVALAFEQPFGLQVSDQSPFADDCGGSGDPQIDAEVEVSQAVDPNDPDHLLMAWQQDRYTSGGGARGVAAAVSFDGGETWATSVIPGLSVCSGGLLPRATDPWAAIGADGTAYVMSLAYDPGPLHDIDVVNLTNAVVINRSDDGGRTWNQPNLVSASPGVIFNDKETLTADPNTPGLLYAVWNAYPAVAFPVFSRSEDWGRTWTPAVPIPSVNLGNGDQIAVLDDGTLVEIARRGSRMQSLTSRDRGTTWSRPTTFGNSAYDEGPPGVRGGADIPSVATDGESVFVSWSDIYSTWFARSDDAGATWQVREVEGDAYPMRSTTAVAATQDGTLAVMTYVVPPGRQTYLALGVSRDGGETWTESQVTDVFDMQRAPMSLGRGYFLGDYFGLSGSGDDVLAAISIVPPGTDEQVADIYSLKVTL